MTDTEIKFANELMYAVKGHLIPKEYSEQDIQSVYDGYMKRLWGNHERMSYCKDDFERLWQSKHEEELEGIAELGYD